MKTVRIMNGVVCEVIPTYALPISNFYSAEFCAQCTIAPDEVEQGWTYDGETFSPPVPMESEDLEPTLDERVTALESAIERGLFL